jgi:hypothetical protein
MEKIDPKVIEEVERKVLASVRGVTQEQVKQIIVLKSSNPELGYRETGKRVGLKKDKVREVWKMVEPMLALAKETSKEPEKPMDEGEFYSEAFSTIEKLLMKGYGPADIAVELVKKFGILPEKARGTVEKYFELKRLNVIELEKKWGKQLRKLQERFGEIDALQELAERIDADMQSLRQRVEVLLSTSQRVEQLEMDMVRVVNSLNRVIRNLNDATDALSHAGLVVKFRSIPELKHL